MKSISKVFLLLVTFMLISVGAFAADTDGDGMDDAWEKKYNLMVENPMDADLDIDGDKISNLDEFKLGTNPRSGKDGNGNGIPDDWEKFYFGKTVDGAADPDKDGFSNADEFANGTNPKKADKKKKKSSTYTRPKPSMNGVRDNSKSNFKYITGKNKINFRDPIGDDKGPGYYTYPTNPVYVKGGFDITEVSIDGSADDLVVFKVQINADVKQEWGMAADFDVQFVQIYIDTDGVPGSGNIRTMPGINIYMDPAHAWDKVVLISPQPQSRVSIEVMAKAKKFEDAVVIPKKVVGQGKILIATVLKRDLGIDKDTDMTKWKYQFFMQSNEGFPDKEDVLTRNVNEYKGLHRFGGGNPYWGDPEILDMLAFPAKGGKDEAALQFKILNVWESYPDPALDVKAVTPMVWANQDKATDTKGLAADLASKMKPAPKSDKYVSENFKLFGKMFTRYSWNLDASQENFIKNSLELGIDGKIFTDVLDFYIRFEQNKWDQTIWSEWANDTPGQVDIALQAQKLILVKPIKTIDTITIGNYEVKYSPWIAGAAWYPDRDKFKGFFVDGNIGENSIIYNAAMYYTLKWLCPGGGEFGSTKGFDFTYVAKVASYGSIIPNLDFAVTAMASPDYEINPVKTTKPSSLLLHTVAQGVEAHVEYSIPALGLSVGGLFAISQVKLGDDWKAMEIAAGVDYDGSGDFGDLAESINNLDHDTVDSAYVLNVKGNNILKSGINFHLQYFNVGDEYAAPGAARGDTSFGAGGFGGASTVGTADVLAMIGNQSAHRSPQAADFTSSIPIPTLPSDFLISDPKLVYSPITWVNDNWEGIAAAGWKGATAIIRYAGDVWRLHAEGSLIKFNESSLSNVSKIRAYAAFNYTFIKVGRGLTATAAFMFESTKRESAYKHSEGGWTVWDDPVNIYMSPSINLDYSFTKTIIGALGVRYELGLADNGDPTGSGTGDPNADKLKYSRLRLSMSLSINTPLGAIVPKAEIWWEGSDNDYAGRAENGAYVVTEWEYAF